MVSAFLSMELIDSLTCGSASRPTSGRNPRSRRAETFARFIASHTVQASVHAMQQEQKKRIMSFVGCGLLLGALPGLVKAVVMRWPELSRRWSWAAGGGSGETADWGEPLFYMVIFASIFGTVGAVVGAVVGAIMAWATRDKRKL